MNRCAQRVALALVMFTAGMAAGAAESKPSATAPKRPAETKPQETKPQETKPKETKPGKPPAIVKPGEFPGQPRLRPKPGDSFVFRSYSYLDGWFEFRDPASVLWPTFVYQRKLGPLSGSFTFDPVAATMAFRLICSSAINTSGDQSRRVLGEWTAAGSPQIVLTIQRCDPWQAPPQPGIDESGKSRRIEEGFYTTVHGTLTVQGVSTPVTSLARLTFATIYKDPEVGVAKAMRVSGSITVTPSSLGLQHPGLGESITVLWNTQANLDSYVAVQESELGKNPNKHRSTANAAIAASLPPMAPLRKRAIAGAGSETVAEIPAAERAAQDLFRVSYYASMDSAVRRTAVESLKGLRDLTTRDLLVQVCLMERDVTLGVDAMRMLAMFPAPDTGEVVATVLFNTPGGVLSVAQYATAAVECPYKSAIAGWFSRMAQRHPWTPIELDRGTKKPKSPPDEKSHRYGEWLTANKNREAWEIIMPAFNRFAGTSIALDPAAMGAVRAWVDANQTALIEADIVRSTATTP